MKIAVLIPCYNEEKTIGKVVDDFRKELPGSPIYVYDNNSKDSTAAIARAHGAIVVREPRQGKGNVVRSMFRDIDADVYVMADGDDTYPASQVRDLIAPVVAGEADMTVGDRLSNLTYAKENKRLFHNFGNNLVRYLINLLFGAKLTDIMSGYRAFDKFFVKTISILSKGFEVETEMTLHCLDKRFLIKEIPIIYKDRPEGSESKLNTFTDGFKVLKTIVWIFKDYKPLVFFGILSLIFFILGLLIGAAPIIEFIRERYVYKIPSAILATGLMLFSVLFFSIGLILDTVEKFYKANYELTLTTLKRAVDIPKASRSARGGRRR